MMPRCAWCYKQSYELKEVTILSTNLSATKRREISFHVCPEHEGNLCKFYDRVRRYALLFLGLIAMSLIGLITSAIFHDNYWSGFLFVLSFASIGLVFILFPFCTPETISIMGVAKSIKIARIMGGVIFALGFIVLVLGLLFG
ncbi:MAG: hypothetical protein ACYTE8_08535 [Planctomycetota bacterium]|jgi:hypothetical protein